jgi:FR47-like protein
LDTTIRSFTSPAGTEEFVGVSGVETRPDVLRRGVARALFEELHARQRRTGRRWALLWTHRTWGAHHLYEELGYRDVYSPPAALRKLGRPADGPVRREYRWRSVRPADDELLERILDTGATGRLGLLPRYSGSFRFRFRMAWRSRSDYRIFLHRSTPVGYVVSTAHRHYRAATEIIVNDARHAIPILDALERESAGRWLALGRTTFITDHEKILRARGYAVYRVSHPTLMAKPLLPGVRVTSRSSPVTVCRSPRFFFHSGDVF